MQGLRRRNRGRTHLESRSAGEEGLSLSRGAALLRKDAGESYRHARQMEERDPSVDVTFGLEMGTVVGVEGFLVALLQADNVCVVAEQFFEHKLLPHVDVEISDRTQRQSQKTGGEGAPGAAVSENALCVRPRNVGVGEDVVGDNAEGRGL